MIKFTLKSCLAKSRSVKSCFLSPVRLSPENQDLNERVRLSPAFFVNHFQDLTVTGVCHTLCNLFQNWCDLESGKNVNLDKAG